jgi:hypothetical protein
MSTNQAYLELSRNKGIQNFQKNKEGRFSQLGTIFGDLLQIGRCRDEVLAA